MTFTIYFELYGKKMKVNIDAYSREDAINKLKSRIIIHQVDEHIEPGDDVVDRLNNIFGLK